MYPNDYRLVNAKIKDYRIWHKRMRSIWLDIMLELEDGTKNKPSLRSSLTSDGGDGFGGRVARLINFFGETSLPNIKGKPARFLERKDSTGPTAMSGFGNQALISYLGDDIWASSKGREKKLLDIYEEVVQRDNVRQFPEE